MPRIVFTPSGLAGEVDTGTTVLTAARQLGVDLDSVCGGRGICGRCQVEPSTGSFAKWAIDSQPTALSDWSSVETDYETKGNARRPLREGRRLGCAAQVLADAVIAVPSESQVHKQVVRKSVDLSGLVIDPQFRLYNVDVPEGRARRLRVVERADRRSHPAHARCRRSFVEHHRVACGPSRRCQRSRLGHARRRR